MIGNVQILKNNGESLVSNGLAHFKFNDTNKQYIIYSLGEQVNELLKIYIGYENAPVTDPGITDADSANITELLKKIGKNEDVSTIVTVLPLSAGLYHIHDKVKKVALQTSAFNNIINAQQRGQIQKLNEDEPIMKENTFFDSSLMNEQKNQAEPVQEQSIFANPMQPVIETSNENLISSEGEIKATNQGGAGETVQQQIIDTKVDETANGNENIINNQISTNITETSGLESGKIISDDEAKNAILAVETAQATIRENIEIIKEFIKQQQNKTVTKTVEATMSDQIETQPTQIDVVNNMELAPQPEVLENVLSNESNLGEENIDTNNQILTSTDTNTVIDTSVSIPEISIPQQVGVEPSLNEQTIPTTAPLTNEPTPEIIDTMSMIPQQGGSNIDLNNFVSNEIPQANMFDTTNMSPIVETNNPQIEETVVDNQASQSVVQDLPVMENQTSTGITMEDQKTQNYMEPQNLQNTILNNQIPDIGIENQIPASEQNINVQVQENIPIQSVSLPENPQQMENSDSVVNNEFAMPQIDMNVSPDAPTPAPVVMPDGQTQDNSQGLVLTPEAFNRAA